MHPADHLGPYELRKLLGEGGMGQVFLAHDSRLDREVAIKVLPPDMALESDRLARFAREARAAAALTHPHIAAVFDIGSEDRLDGGTVHFMVQEYLRGKSLRAKLESGALTVKRTIELGTEIASGLAAAHGAGIVHRDLKPDNVLVTEDGRAKILDFGIAKLLSEAPPPAELADSATMATAAGAGGTVGTPGYMAPEQIIGAETDHRVDLFAFGCLVYEMATGSRAFPGRNVGEMLSAGVRGEPESLASLRSDLPSELARIVGKCLMKDASDRYQSAADLAVDLRMLRVSVESGTAPSLAALPRPAPARSRAFMLAAMGVAAAFFLAAGWYLGTRVAGDSQPHGSTLRNSTIELASGAEVGGSWSAPMALSPDGQTLVYTARRGERSELFARRLDGFDAAPIEGTEAGNSPFFSPDGQWLGFLTNDGELKRVAMAGGAATVVAHVGGTFHGASWGPDGQIVFAAAVFSGLQSIPSDGGEPVPLTHVAEDSGVEHRWPRHLPDGRTLLYVRLERGADPTEGTLVARDLVDGTERDLPIIGTDPRFVVGPDGVARLLVMQSPGLVAIPVDGNSLEALGPPRPVARVNLNSVVGSGGFAATGDLLIYLQPRGEDRSDMVWVTREGTATPALEGAPRVFHQPRVSPDGRRIVVTVVDRARPDLWVYDLELGTSERLTFEGANVFPVWSPDGSRIAFSSSRGGPFQLYVRNADGSGQAELLFDRPATSISTSWTPEGVAINFDREMDGRGQLLLLDPETGESRVILDTPADERAPAVSPDGRWIAYLSDETGAFELYVRGMNAEGGRWQVSRNGASEPRWARDGSEIFYRQGSVIMAAAVRPGESFRTATPRRLFEGFERDVFMNPNYDVADDGRLLMLRPLPRASAGSLLAVVGYLAGDPSE